MPERDKILSVIKKAFVDAFGINSKKLYKKDIKLITAELNYFDELIIQMPAELASNLESHHFFRFRYQPIQVIIRCDEYLSDLNVSKEEIVEYISSEN